MPSPLATLSDEALLAQMARGAEPALAELYDRFARIAYGLAVRVLRDQALAEDAVQDAFLGAWRTAAAFDPKRGTASTWLMTLVHRRAVDLVRRRTDAAPICSTTRRSPRERRPTSRREVREERRRVQAALGRLPADQREALELAYYGGLTQSELAERLGVPIGTIKSRMFAGLGKLRDLLGE